VRSPTEKVRTFLRPGRCPAVRRASSYLLWFWSDRWARSAHARTRLGGVLLNVGKVRRVLATDTEVTIQLGWSAQLRLRQERVPFISTFCTTRMGTDTTDYRRANSPPVP
jgi:hypothetical protein